MIRSAVNLRSNINAFSELKLLLTRHRVLTYELARREIMDRHAGQFFGWFWSFVHPLVLITIYVFLFNFVYVTKVGNSIPRPSDMTTYILSGIIPWLTFSESMSKAATVIVINANLVKQVIFPVEVLPVKGVFASLFTQLILVSLMIIYTLIKYHTLSLMYLLLPLVIIWQVLAMIGASYALSSVGVYLRDTKDLVQVFVTLGMWFVPILYQPEAIPAMIRPLLYVNPFAHLVWCYQDILYFGRFEHPISWVVFIVLCPVTFLLGYRLFRKLKLMFGNVL